MFGHKKPKTEEVEQPERLHYTKYYEHDGALRAYANRAMVLACSMSLLAFLSLAFAIYVRMQPPTIIRVNADGESTVLSGRPLFRKQVPASPSRSSPVCPAAGLREGGLHSPVPRPLPELRRAQRGSPVGLGAQFHEFQPEVFSAESHAERKQRWQNRGRKHKVGIPSARDRDVEGRPDAVHRLRSARACTAWMATAKSSRPRSTSTAFAWPTRTVPRRTPADCWWASTPKNRSMAKRRQRCWPPTRKATACCGNNRSSHTEYLEVICARDDKGQRCGAGGSKY